jgi:hypothetical protein
MRNRAGSDSVANRVAIRFIWRWLILGMAN